MLNVIPMVVALGTGPGVVCLPAGTGPGEWTARAPVPVPVRAVQPTLEELYRGGATWDAFYRATKARKQLWDENWGRAVVPGGLLARARAVPGTWRILIIAVDTCSDSVSTIPFIAKLVAAVDALDMRIIDPEVGRPLMEARRTPDGRAATPTVILLNDGYEEVGCWIERPSRLQTWYLEQQKTTPQRELTEKKMEWYRTDAGAETLREMVELMEAASRGRTGCGTSNGGQEDGLSGWMMGNGSTDQRIMTAGRRVGCRDG